jgi:putative ABC transport system ATP-binding protein
MLHLEHISHRYGQEQILHNISLEIGDGSFTVISGESGSGKSTLLSIISTLLKPTGGKLYFDGLESRMIKDIDHFRKEEIGFVFQFHYLISYLTVYENIAMASNRSREEIETLLTSLNIAELADKYPDEISGGQRQRAAIARALINRPKYIFADEPTGNLDSKNSQIVFELLHQLDATVIVATHDAQMIGPTDTLITLKDGALC